MKSRFDNLFVIWLILVAATLMSVGIVETELLGSLSFVAVILIAALKSRLVILEYMEARHCPKHWRFLYETWNFSMAATIIIGQTMTLR